jgi:hypothetical protein
MHVRMVQQILPPRVQDRDETDLRAQVFRVGGNRAQRRGAGAKQQIVEHLLVLVRERGNGLRKREDHMEILDLGQQFSLPVFEPLRAGERLALGTMAIATRVVGDPLMAARVALLDMTAERGGATQLDGAHRAPLGTTECVGMGLPILRAAAAEDVRYFERRSHRGLQKYSGAGGWEGTGAGYGSRSKGLGVAHTVLVATLR